MEKEYVPRHLLYGVFVVAILAAVVNLFWPKKEAHKADTPRQVEKVEVKESVTNPTRPVERAEETKVVEEKAKDDNAVDVGQIDTQPEAAPELIEAVPVESPQETAAVDAEETKQQPAPEESKDDKSEVDEFRAGPEDHRYQHIHEFTGEMWDHLRDLDGRIARDRKMLKELEGKNLILIIGNTGAGKSTLVNALVQEGSIRENPKTEDLELDPAFETIKIGRRVMFEIGMGAISKTETPGYCPLEGEEDVYLVDCPGFNDSNRKKEFSNRSTVHNIIRQAKSVKFCVIFTSANIENDRGVGVIKQMTTLSRILTNDARLTMDKMLMPLLTKEGKLTPVKLRKKMEDMMSVLKGKIGTLRKQYLKQKLTQEDDDFSNSFIGPEFPQLGEELRYVKHVIGECLKMMKQVNPMDELDKKFKEEKMTLKLDDIKKGFQDKDSIMPDIGCSKELDKALERELYDLIDKLAETEEFKKRKDVREEVRLAFYRVIDSYEGEGINAVRNALDSHIRYREQIDSWKDNVMDKIGEHLRRQVITSSIYGCSAEDQKKPFYLFFSAFLKANYKCTQTELNGRFEWKDWTWFLDWLVQNHQLFKGSRIPKKPTANTKKDAPEPTMEDILTTFKNDYGSATDEQKKKTVAFKFGKDVEKWMKLCWLKLYESRNSKQIIYFFMFPGSVLEDVSKFFLKSQEEEITEEEKKQSEAN